MVLAVEAVLLFQSRSFSSERTLGLFEISPGAMAMTRIVTVTTALGSRVPISQVTIPSDSVQMPWSAFAERKSVSSGSGSMTWTLLALVGPFVTVIVYVSSLLMVAVAGTTD